MKHNRHLQIVQIITESEIETQEELIAHLRERGYPVTQATVSRDIRELHLIKVAAPSGRYCYACPSEQPRRTVGIYQNILQDAVTAIDAAGNMVVIKTYPGMANSVAVALEAMHLPEMVGTLAGDDTIFLVMRTAQAASSFDTEIEAQLQKNG